MVGTKHRSIFRVCSGVSMVQTLGHFFFECGRGRPECGSVEDAAHRVGTQARVPTGRLGDLRGNAAGFPIGMRLAQCHYLRGDRSVRLMRVTRGRGARHIQPGKAKRIEPRLPVIEGAPTNTCNRTGRRHTTRLLPCGEEQVALLQSRWAKIGALWCHTWSVSYNGIVCKGF